MSAGRALLLGLVLAGCAASQRGELARQGAAAERAYSAGRYAEAATRWGEIADKARRPADRDEARYRQGASLVRAGQPALARAIFDRLLQDSPNGVRGPRAALDRARLEEEAGRAADAEKSLEWLIENHPESGLAPAALHDLLELLAPRGEVAIRAYLDARLPLLENTELGEHLHAAYAASLERSGDLAGARSRYLLVAERYPYPGGALWDDALFHAADLAARRGAPAQAIRDLERMLSKREAAYIQGSYERGRYGEAQYRIAELYRDALHDAVRARAEFERLWSAHRTSRLRDDAAWNAAQLAAGAGDAAGACADLEALVRELPSSRYVGCASRLCPLLKTPPQAGACHEYLTRAQGEPRD
ncbi:MAG TPA: tetratricopeptide repeat protein [Polyangiaceae bacterium]